MATPIKLYKYTVNGQLQYEALPWAGNIPQGYSEIGYEEFAKKAPKNYYSSPSDNQYTQAMAKYPQIAQANPISQEITMVKGVPMNTAGMAQGAANAANPNMINIGTAVAPAYAPKGSAAATKQHKKRSHIGVTAAPAQKGTTYDYSQYYKTKSPTGFDIFKKGGQKLSYEEALPMFKSGFNAEFVPMGQAPTAQSQQPPSPHDYNQYSIAQNPNPQTGGKDIAFGGQVQTYDQMKDKFGAGFDVSQIKNIYNPPATPTATTATAQPIDPIDSIDSIDSIDPTDPTDNSQQIRDIYQTNFGRQPTQIELSDQIKNIQSGSASIASITNWATTNPQNIKTTGAVSQPQAFQGAPLPTTATEVKTGFTAPPDLTTPAAGNITDQYTQSAIANLATQRKALEDAYQKQIDDSKTQSAASQAKIDALNQQYKDTLDQAKPLTDPFREELERTERERLKVEENYFANQKLVNELETLLTDIQTQIQAEKNITGLAAIREPRIAKAKEDAMGRVGVIEAVMAARNGQITVANNLIDRASNAIAADRQDKLSYYNTLLNFYDKQKGEEGAKLLALTNEQKGWVAAQVNLLQNDLVISQANVEAIKKAMTDPDTALAYAQSGVTLNDNSAQINAKLANYGYAKEISTTSKDMAGKGYIYLAPGQTAPAGSEIATITDTKGVQKTFYKAPTVKAPATTSDITEYEYAVNGGYKGTFNQWQSQQANLKARGGAETATERQASLVMSELKKAAIELDKVGVGQDGYIDPSVYMKLQTNYAMSIGNISDFKNTFASYLSPQERAKLGVGKAVGVTAIPKEETITKRKKEAGFVVDQMKNDNLSLDEIKKYIKSEKYSPNEEYFISKLNNYIPTKTKSLWDWVTGK